MRVKSSEIAPGRGWEMPGPRAAQNVQMPHPRVWKGGQMPRSSPGGGGGGGWAQLESTDAAASSSKFTAMGIPSG